jgi:subfamily B ATP-binding cassette protein MsbA
MNDIAWHRLLPRLRPYAGRFAAAAVAMGFVAATNGAGAYLLKPIVDDAFVSKNVAKLNWVVIALPLIFLLRTGAAYIQNYLMSYIGQSVTQDLRRDLFAHLHTLSMDFFWRNRSGELLSRATNDLTQLESTLHFVPLYFIRDSLTVVALAVVLVMLEVRFAAVALAGLPLVGLVIYVLGKKMRDASIKSQRLMAELYQKFQESLQGILVIKAFNYESGAAKRFDAENRRFYDQMMRYLRATALAGPLTEMLGGLVLAAIIYFAGRQILAGTLTPGAFFSFLACFFAAYAPTKNLARSNAELQRGLAGASRIFEVLDTKPTVIETKGGLVCRGIQSSLELKDISFRYPERETWALKGASLSVGRGQMVGLVGPSGGGKSTIVQLLLRLVDPAEGKVLLDGEPLAAYDTASLRAQIGLVTQETVLFHDTIAANVALGRPEASEEEIAEACRLADADGFVRQLPEGYRTVVGDRGVKLSGGQRQRLAIARALLKRPPILLLDEATSNLDSESEAAVQRALERALAGRTVIQIAHRLSTVQNADRIFVLSQGAVVESGRHDELLRLDGVYAKLYRIQSQGIEVA